MVTGTVGEDRNGSLVLHISHNFCLSSTVALIFELTYFSSGAGEYT